MNALCERRREATAFKRRRAVRRTLAGHRQCVGNASAGRRRAAFLQGARECTSHRAPVAYPLPITLGSSPWLMPPPMILSLSLLPMLLLLLLLLLLVQVLVLVQVQVLVQVLVLVPGWAGLGWAGPGRAGPSRAEPGRCRNRRRAGRRHDSIAAAPSARRKCALLQIVKIVLAPPKTKLAKWRLDSFGKRIRRRFRRFRALYFSRYAGLNRSRGKDSCPVPFSRPYGWTTSYCNLPRSIPAGSSKARPSRAAAGGRAAPIRRRRCGSGIAPRGASTGTSTATRPST
ncbi:hypothetical protein BPC006_II1086 [Burkholderia pseudomallei BPC006]|nr:hypothetical protein BPC006_II1086 [Burkholderia pseudomallei BPC006]